jgi:hypothetical protein
MRYLVAAVVLATVVVGAVIDDGTDTPRESVTLVDVTTTTSPAPDTDPTVVLPPEPRIASTTTTVAPHVEGDDDPEAIDGRTWTWDQLADCESGAWGANRVPIPGTARWDVTRSIYQGGLQFAAGTWDAYKEPGFPEDAHIATREQQIVVAEKVIQRQGPRAWPTCAPRLGMIGTDLPLDAPVEPSVPLAEALP